MYIQFNRKYEIFENKEVIFKVNFPKNNNIYSLQINNTLYIRRGKQCMASSEERNKHAETSAYVPRTGMDAKISQRKTN